MDQQLGVAHIGRVQHLHVDGPEQVGGVRSDFRRGFLVHPTLVVEEVEVELDGPLHVARIHVTVLPVERRDSGAVAPVVAVLVVPGELLTGTRIFGTRLFREGPAGLPAVDLTHLITEGYLIHGHPGSLHVARVQVE